MKRLLIAVVALLVLLAGAGIFFFRPAGLDAVKASAAQPRGPALVEKGRYLATAGDCVACHTVPGGKPFAGGLAFTLPFGTLYSSNITPDPKAGIGAWSNAQFVRAMRHGVRGDGKDLYPAFPYTAYAKMSTDDLLAVRAYLASLAPVAAAPPANDLAFPFNQRFVMRAWKLLFLDDAQMAPQPAQSPEWNRGAYLVEALGHCGECHTPRNLAYGLSGKKFAGATTQGWKAYNITSDPKSGIGGWSVDQLAAYLGTGHAEGRGTASGSMAEVVSLSLSHLTPPDLRAMAVYLKSVPPRPSQDGEDIDATPPTLAKASLALPAPGSAGKDNAMGLRIFATACAGCHAWNGEGTPGPDAALRGARGANDPQAANMIQTILHGAPGRMPAFGRAYRDAEIAAVSNYVVHHFGGKTGHVTPAQVAEARAIGH